MGLAAVIWAAKVGMANKRCFWHSSLGLRARSSGSAGWTCAPEECARADSASLKVPCLECDILPVDHVLRNAAGALRKACSYGRYTVSSPQALMRDLKTSKATSAHYTNCRSAADTLQKLRYAASMAMLPHAHRPAGSSGRLEQRQHRRGRSGGRRSRCQGRTSASRSP